MPQLTPEEIEELLREIRLTRFTMAEAARGLTERMERLESAVEARIPVRPEEITALREALTEIAALGDRLRTTIRAVERGVPLWYAEREREEEARWFARRERGEVQITEFITPRNRYEEWHHKPTSERWLRVIPLL